MDNYARSWPYLFAYLQLKSHVPMNHSEWKMHRAISNKTDFVSSQKIPIYYIFGIEMRPTIGWATGIYVPFQINANKFNLISGFCILLEIYSFLYLLVCFPHHLCVVFLCSIISCVLFGIFFPSRLPKCVFVQKLLAWINFLLFFFQTEQKYFH